jgi:hypothetical protein
MPDTTNDIDALLEFLQLASRRSYATIPSGVAADYHAALTALVAERDKLAERLETERNIRHLHEQFASEKAAASDLRERLVCAALTGAMTLEGWRSRDAMADEVVATADAMLAAMRKGEA